MRRGSNPRCEGARGEVVREYLKDPKGWKEKIGYGKRWMIETFFSWFKRETVLARKFERMVKEIEQKVWIYNLMVGMMARKTLSCEG